MLSDLDQLPHGEVKQAAVLILVLMEYALWPENIADILSEWGS